MIFYHNEVMRENSEPVFDKHGQRKMFFPFRELRNDEVYSKLNEKLAQSKRSNPTEALQTKLNWNARMQSKQKQAVKEISTRTFSELMTTARQWKVKTQKNPVVIKR